MNTLRSELLGEAAEALPTFRMLLPEGWTAHDTGAESERQLLAQLRARLMPLHRVDLLGILEAHVTAAMAAARERGAILMIMPGPETQGALFAPASMLVTVREASAEYTLDDVVVDVLQNRGGQALDENRRFVRWVETSAVRVAGDSVGAYSIVYLTPIPGTERRKALQFILTIAHPTDVDTDSDELLTAWATLVDAHVATFRWNK